MFKNYKKLSYKVDDYHYLTGVDITQRVKINDRIRTFGATDARNYIILDGEKPEYVAYTFYGNPSYAYAILLLNGIHNMYDEWPRSGETLKKYIIEKYGSLSYAQTNIAYYYVNDIITSQQAYESSSETDKYSQSIYQYEEYLNNEKRNIKLLDPSLIKKLDVAIREILNSTENL
jgi:hypothetical protein